MDVPMGSFSKPSQITWVTEEDAFSLLPAHKADVTIGDMNPIDHPTHYTQAAAAGFEVIDALEAWQKAGMIDFRLANVIKYVTRHRFKRGAEDLRKAVWYLQRYISKEYPNE